MLIAWLKAKAAAKRMGIRDRGLVGVQRDEVGAFVIIHPFCKTRTRVGIRSDESTVTYCWRCEKITSENNDGAERPEDSPEDSHKFKLLKFDKGKKNA